MSKDSVDTLGRFAARRAIGMTLISDENSEIITAFGVRDDQYGTSGLYSGIARPTIFVVGADGTVRHRIAVDHNTPPPVDAVLKALGG